MKRRPRWLLPALALLVIGGGFVWAFRPRVIDVDTAVVSRGLLRITVDEDGRTRIRERYVVTAPLAGSMHRIDLQAGDKIDAGARITTIVPTAPALLDVRDHLRAEAAVQATAAAREVSRASVERAREGLDFARSETARRVAMASRNVIAQQELDDWRHRTRVAEAELRSAEMASLVAEFEWQQAKAALVHVRPQNGDPPPPPRFDVTSPVGGRILRLIEENEGVVSAGTRLLEVGDPLDLEVEVDVLSRDAVRIPEGAKVLFERWGGDQPLLGRVRRVEPAAFTKVSALGIEEQRVYVIIDFLTDAEQRAALGDGYRVEARIVVWENSDVVKAPAGSLFRVGETWTAFVVENGVPRAREVRIGRSDGIETEVVDGLVPGDVVILHPDERIRDGVSVCPR